MQVVYNKLFDLLKEKGIIMKTFRNDTKLGGSIITRLQHNEPITTDTIAKICVYLKCQPNDIMEIKLDGNEATYEDIRKLEVERQIAELQEKLKKMN